MGGVYREALSRVCLVENCNKEEVEVEHHGHHDLHDYLHVCLLLSKYDHRLLLRML